MDSWRLEVIDSLVTASCFDVAFALIARYARDLNFEYCSYGISLRLPIARGAITMINNYPLRWQQRYKDHSYLLIDPTVRHALKRDEPILWPEEPLEALEFWEEAWKHGLRHGWALPMREPGGTLGLLTVGRSHDVITAHELGQIEAQLYFLAQVGHRVLYSLLVPSLLPEMRSPLSGREREVLCWSAEGKTSGEIASILGLTGRTVNFHVKNAMRKLRSSNKTHAVAKAALMGILAPQAVLARGLSAISTVPIAHEPRWVCNDADEYLHRSWPTLSSDLLDPSALRRSDADLRGEQDTDNSREVQQPVPAPPLCCRRC